MYAWCTQLGRSHRFGSPDVVEFEWNKLNQLEDIFKKSKNKVVAILTPTTIIFAPQKCQ